jgi:geranylgeranyl diphosphate synthase type I
VAAAIEILHNFSLVHDDIEDHDPERRHRPTLWKVWGEPQALNAGDGMHALAGRAVLALDATEAQRLELAVAFAEMTLALTRGQFLDMNFETRTQVSAAEYLEMITLKSAAIIAFSTWAGALIAGAGTHTCDALRSYGRHLGRAFQIEDDIQGIWGQPEQTGKQPATDVRNRKKTLPVLLALEQAHGEDADRLARFYRAAEDDVDVVLRVIDSLGVREQAEEAAGHELSLALRSLDGAQLADSARERLGVLSRELTGAQIRTMAPRDRS